MDMREVNHQVRVTQGVRLSLSVETVANQSETGARKIQSNQVNTITG